MNLDLIEAAVISGQLLSNNWPNSTGSSPLTKLYTRDGGDGP